MTEEERPITSYLARALRGQFEGSRLRLRSGLTLGAALSIVMFWQAPALAEVGQYQFWGSGQVLSADSVYVIVKGAKNPVASTTQQLINYEQSFALNAKQAQHARSQGWLAHTCAGAEIHPRNIPSVWLMNAEIPGAVDWRSTAIAEETVARGRVGTFLDTLRPYFPDSFYDGVPCDVQQNHAAGDAAWRIGSANLVNEVRVKTGGRMIIANGAGMQSGKNYFAHQSAVDEFLLLARPEGVQIEQFGRSKGMVLDANFMRSLGSKGIITFAKCDGTTSSCQTTFANGLNGSAYMTIPPPS